MKRGIIFAIAALSAYLMPLTQANLIADTLENEFMRTSASFVVFFAVIFFALKKIAFGEERAINTVVSGVIAYFTAVIFSDKLGELVMNNEYMMYIYIVFFIFGLVLLGRALFGIFGTGREMKRLKWISNIYFILYLVYLFNIPDIEFIDNIKNEIPLNVSTIINILGIISGIHLVIQVILGILKSIPHRFMVVLKHKAKEKAEEARAERMEKVQEAWDARRRASEEKAEEERERRKRVEADAERERERKERMKKVQEAWDARKREREERKKEKEEDERKKSEEFKKLIMKK